MTHTSKRRAFFSHLTFFIQGFSNGVGCRRNAALKNQHRAISDQLKAAEQGAGDNWTVEEVDESGMEYRVQLGTKEPVLVQRDVQHLDCLCKSSCKYCCVCLHLLSCSCDTSFLGAAVCVHIHFLHMKTTSEEEIRRLRVCLLS